jgi:hypothetical protein
LLCINKAVAFVLYIFLVGGYEHLGGDSSLKTSASTRKLELPTRLNSALKQKTRV